MPKATDANSESAAPGKVKSDFRPTDSEIAKMLALQREIAEALAQANRLAFDIVHAAWLRQLGVVQESVTDFAMLRDDPARSAGSLKERIERYVEFWNLAFERTFSNAREIAELGGILGEVPGRCAAAKQNRE